MSKAKSENIYASGTLWAKLILDKRAEAKKPEGRDDAYVFFVGDKSAGKTFARERLLYPTKAPKDKPSEGLEYTFLRKAAQHSHDRKDVAHIWELAGGNELAQSVVDSEAQFMTMKQVKTGVVVVVVDLSEPSTTVERAVHWLGAVRGKLTATYEKMAKKGSALPTQLLGRAKARLFAEGHPDRDAVLHSGVSLLLLAAKYDAFEAATQDVEARRVMARALRFVAHAHGAHLAYVGDLDKARPPSNAGKACKEALDNMLPNYRKLLNQMIFNGFDRKLVLKTESAFDHLGPLFVLAGTDSFKAIGLPTGGGGLDPSIANAQSIAHASNDWVAATLKAFPQRGDPATAPRAGEQEDEYGADARGRSPSRKPSLAARKAKFRGMLAERYPEPDVDALFVAKEEELKQYLADQKAVLESKRRALAARQAEIDKRKAAAAKKKKEAAK